MACEALGLPKEMLAVLSPVVPTGSSDTGSFDSVMELLVHCGRDIPEVSCMVVQELWAVHVNIHILGLSGLNQADVLMIHHHR